MDRKRTKKNLFGLAIFLFGLIIGSISAAAIIKNVSPVFEVRSGGYKLINPLYACITNDETQDKKYQALEKEIVDYINESISDKDINRMSVFFSDLNTGAWFGVNEKANFAPASLLKVPIAMAVYKQAESDATILKKSIKYEAPALESSFEQIVKPRSPIVPGREYSAEELLEKMLKNSDNEAAKLLVDYIGGAKVDHVSKDLGVSLATVGDSMSVRDYSIFFKVLYDASYLNNNFSEKQLSLLTKTTFNNGINKPIPSAIPVAHKFGEREIETAKQLHDCGIIYYNDNPYLLCIMSEGSDFQKLLLTIQEVSRTVYEEVDKKYNNN